VSLFKHAADKLDAEMEAIDRQLRKGLCGGAGCKKLGIPPSPPSQHVENSEELDARYDELLDQWLQLKEVDGE